MIGSAGDGSGPRLEWDEIIEKCQNVREEELKVRTVSQSDLKV